MSSSKIPSKGGSGFGLTVSRAASKFLMGSSESTRRASYWRSDEAEPATPTTAVATTSAAAPSNAPSPWWLEDDLWDADEDEGVEMPAYPPPSYEEASLNRMPATDSSLTGDDMSAASLLSNKPAMNRSLTAISLKSQSQDDSVVSYKGRGRGRRRRVANLKRSGSLGSLHFTSDDGRGPVSVALQNQTTKAGQFIKRPKIHKVSIPYFTIIITLIDIIMMIWEFIEGKGFAPPKLNPMLGPNGVVLIKMGGKWVPAILKGGEWWRFFTSMFLHGGLVHILLNLLSQTKVLWDLEKVHGTFRVVPIYILSGAGGMLLSAVFLPNQVTVGASGAIFGFEAVLLVDLIKNWSHVKSPKSKLLLVGVSIIIAFAMGLLPGIDNFAHFGGFVVGLLSAFVFLPSMHIGGWSVGMRLIQVCIALPLLIAYFVGFLVPFYHSFDGKTFCTWCHYIACLPFWKTCNGGS